MKNVYSNEKMDEVKLIARFDMWLSEPFLPNIILESMI